MKRLAPYLVALCVLFTIGFGNVASRADDAAPPAPRTVILLRHAEKDADAKDPRDPGLSFAGWGRSQELVRLLGASRATHIFTSELARTRETVAPLAAHLGLASEAVPAAKSEAVVAKLDALPAGSVAVVCGHSNTIPRIAELLGSKLAGLVETKGTAMLADDSYDRVFIVTRPASGPASCVELNYGFSPRATSSSGK